MIKMNLVTRPLMMLCFFNYAVPCMAQQAGADTELRNKASEWVSALALPDKSKENKVTEALVTHLTAVRDWHNAHPTSEVPAGINPTTGNSLSELDRQVIICSAKPKTVRDNLISTLKSELDSAQIELILDKYTVGKVAFTLQGYRAIVPSLTAKEEAEIVKQLKQARSQAIDFKNMNEISAIFEIYKTKCEQYLNNNGRNWRQLFKAYVDKVKAEKEALKKQQ